MNEVIDMLAPEPAAKPATAVALQSAPLAGPMGMALQAMSMGMTVADLHGLLALQKDHEANEARKAYVADMAEFKRNPPEIWKDKQVGFGHKEGGGGTSYSHATLGNVCELIVAALAKHGFSHRWDTRQHSGGIIEVTCEITHRMGHSERTTMSAGADSSGKKNPIQQVASSITYLQRYTLLASTGMATKDGSDDDGAGGAEGAREDGMWEEKRRVLDGWIAAVKCAATPEDVATIRKSANVSFMVSGDKDAWELVKKACTDRRNELAPQAHQTAQQP